MRGPRFFVCGHFDSDDQIASIKDVIALGRAAGQSMEIWEWNSSFASLPLHDDDRIHGGKRDR
jgi:hypothetical protein